MVGSIISPFFLESDHYIADRTMKMIDKTTSSMMENGLFKFYTSLASFKQKFIERNSQHENDFQALSMNELKRPMKLLLGLCAFATFIFLFEFAISKWRNWRNQHRQG